ncbi:hypothetical protein [Gordonia alkanivorans]|uniref:hypothetical protein n=1 Tax=Gordonia alkanivorans TaxID=84096 RepID=UPI0004AC5E0E|nr:hypothetical protein [Gordonia alkanivorans]
MGSISFEIDQRADVKQEVLRYLRGVLPTDVELVDHSFGPGDGYRGSFTWGGVLYAAVAEPTTDGGDRPVTMHVIAFRVDRVDGYRSLAIKCMHEDEEPYYQQPAQRVMAALTSTTDVRSLEWRTGVVEGYDFRRTQRAKARRAIGRTITLGRPLTYGGGIGDIDSVEVIATNRWRDPNTGTYLRPPRRWQESAFDIVGDTTELTAAPTSAD